MAYNGWTNYETWNVALWIDNDEGTYRMAREWTQEAWEQSDVERTYVSQTRMDRATYVLAETIKVFVEENNPLASEASMYSDMLNAAIGEVNWYEIAENWMEDVDKGDDDGEAADAGGAS